MMLSCHILVCSSRRSTVGLFVFRLSHISHCTRDTTDHETKHAYGHASKPGTSRLCNSSSSNLADLYHTWRARREAPLTTETKKQTTIQPTRNLTRMQQQQQQQPQQEGHQQQFGRGFRSFVTWLSDGPKMSKRCSFDTADFG